MTALEYLKAKNDLVERITGYILIPEDQLVEHAPDMLRFNPMPGLSISNCTYCTLYYYENCDGCPMKEAGNRCIENLESSYRKVRDVWFEKITKKDKEELQKLGEQFQKEYEE